MLKPGDQHLTDEEVDRLSRTHRTTGSAQDDDLRDRAGKHLSECPDCQRRLEQAVALNDKLAFVRTGVPRSRGDLCPVENEWLNLAAGLKTESDSKHMIEHAANCDYCGPLLKEATAVLSDESSANEHEIVNSLESATPAWQTALAQRLAAKPATLAPGQVATGREQETVAYGFWKRFWSVPRLAWAAGLVVLMLLVWFSSRQFISPDVNHLLAKSYTERRLIEFRIRGAEFAPMRTERRTSGSMLDAPQALLEADALISRKLRAAPEDPSWLDAKGRAELLGGDYKAAIKTLQEAQDFNPSSSDVLADLAAAYFQRAEVEDRPLDYGLTIDLLSKALKKNPDDTILLFNRAIAAERAFLFTQASEDWEHYLRLDPNGEWASEARKRLKTLQEKLHGYERNSLQPLWGAARVASPYAGHDRAEAELDAKIEEYLHLALTAWVPNQFALVGDASHPASSSPEKLALNALAAVAYRNHRDAWLKEFISTVPSAEFGAATRALQAAVIFADHGDFQSATDQSSKAAALFHKSANKPGEIRARFQTVYSFQLSNKSEACLRESRDLTSELDGTQFTWLQIQALTESAVCRNMAGDIADARLLAKRASTLARETNYKSLELRVTSMAAAFEADVGNHSEAWRLVQTGLTQFWSTASPRMRGYNLYADLDEIADTLELHDLRVVVWKQATQLIASDSDTLLRAMAQLRLADAALKARTPILARTAFLEGNRLLNLLPQDEAVQNSQIEASIWFARYELSNGEPENALRLLTDRSSAVAKASSRYVTIDFYRTLGELQMWRGDLADAERSLDLAVDSAETALRSLNSEDDRQRWNQETSGAYRALTALKLKKGDQVGALEFWEWYRGAIVRSPTTSHASKPDPDTRSRAANLALTRVLQHGGTSADRSIISFALLPDALTIWVIDDRGTRSHSVQIDAMALAHLTRRFVALCSDPASDLSAVHLVGKELYQILLAPVSSELPPNQQIIIEADSPITEIPIEALVDGAGHYFGETHAVTWSEGIYFSQRLRSTTKIAAGTSNILVVADPAHSTDSDLPSLASALQEGQKVSSLFSNSILLTGQRATWSNVKKYLPASSVFHFAGHALANETQAGLLLAQDSVQPSNPSFLNQRTLPRHSLQGTRLTVLAACRTEQGTRGTPFDTDALAMIFMKSGVPNVVASRWNVDSEVTAILMESFYKNLLAGTPVADSLRLSASEVRARHETNHPYYWAAFNAFGRS